MTIKELIEKRATAWEAAKAFLESHPEFEVIDLPETFPEEQRKQNTENGLQLLGCRDGVEGFFIARMRRVR